MPWEDVEAFLRNFIDGAVTDPRGARFHYREAALESLAESHGYRSEIVVDPRASCKGCRLEKASGVRTGLEAAHRHGKHLKLSLLPTINDLRPSGDA